MEKDIRTQEFYDNWSHETNDPETQEWRDDLTPEELEQVERWDEGYLDGIEKMAAHILEMEEKAGYQYYRIMRDPEESWQPYKSEPIYDEHPEMGTFRSSCGMPKAGDYLVKTEDGVTVRSADIYPDRVEFSALPPLDELIKSGMLVPASEEIMELDIAWQYQIEDLRRYMVNLQDYMQNRTVALHSSQGNPENARNAMEDLQKLQAELAKQEGKLLDLEAEYQRFCDENLRVGDAQELLPDRTFIAPDAWPSKIVPKNAAELAAAFNRSMNEYIRKTDLLPQIAEDEIQKEADRLWESYCKTGEIAGVREQAAEYYDQFEEERNAATPWPIGRIDFLRSNGLVGESVEYTDPKKFEADLKKETHYGAPLCVVLYRDQDGKVPEHKFIFQLDPPPKGLTVTDNPYACEMVQEEPEIEQDYEMEM